MTVTARPRSSLRLRGRSFLALVLAPQAPLSAWLAELDALVQGSPGFFVARPVLLDVSALGLDESGLAALVADLSERNVRVMGIEGAGTLNLGLGMPPLVSSGRHHDLAEPGEPVAAETPKPSAPASLLLTEPVRSGQSVIFPQGDVTIVGSVASGAEVVAGGSIHIYGTLRGRADRRLDRQCRRPHLLPQARGRAGGDRRPLSHRRRHGGALSRARRSRPGSRAKRSRWRR